MLPAKPRRPAQTRAQGLGFLLQAGEPKPPLFLPEPHSNTTPAGVIVADTESGSEKWLELNTKYSEVWPNITQKKDPPVDHEKYKNEKNKYEKYFNENL